MLGAYVFDLFWCLVSGDENLGLASTGSCSTPWICKPNGIDDHRNLKDAVRTYERASAKIFKILFWTVLILLICDGDVI